MCVVAVGSVGVVDDVYVFLDSLSGLFWSKEDRRVSELFQRPGQRATKSSVSASF